MTLRELSKDLWVVGAPLRVVGLRLGTRMTVVRLRDGLWIHSPVELTAALKAEVDVLGPVRHIVAPNLEHHLYAGQWTAAFPDALLHAPSPLRARREDLRIDRYLDGNVHGEWDSDLEAVFVDGTTLYETAFLHRRSGSLIVSDVLENFGTSAHWPTRAYLKVSGVHGEPGVSLATRLMHRNKKAARRAIDAILAWDFDRVVLAHGNVIDTRGHQALERAYGWLRG